MIYRVHHGNSISGHPAYELASKASKLHANGGDNFEASPNWDSEFVFIEVDGRPVAVTTFSRTKWKRTINVGYSFVDEAFRNNGLFSILSQALEVIAREDGYNTISRSTKSYNEPMMAAIKSNGYEDQKIVYFTKRLPDSNRPVLREKGEYDFLPKQQEV